jgi:predicted SnoaL-like aldol condensation-catalyzing enzyme
MQMKSFKALGLLASVALALSSSTAASAADNQAYDNMIGLTTPDGKLAYDFINLWFNEKKGAEAFDKYVSRDNYMNHAVYNSSTSKPKTFEQEKAEETRIVPAGARFVFKQLIAQGGLVFAHINAFQGPGGPGDEMVMILRVQNGKITDHWDLHTELKEDSAVFASLDRVPGVITAAATARPPAGAGPMTNSGIKLDQSPLLKAADKNHDGKVTKQEWAAIKGSDSIFGAINKNNDEYLTLAELNASSPPDIADANRDGKLSVQEFQAIVGASGGPPASGPPSSGPPAGGPPAGAPPRQ